MKEVDKIQNKIISFDNIQKQVLKWREENKKIVFTNGCFDIIHRGHVDYLSKAKDLGDILIIGLNTDQSVRNIKGNTRPIQDENSRAINLASMQFDDAIVFLSQPTTHTLIKEIQPDILVKGADYKKEDIVGYDIVSQRGGKVETIEFIEGYSTSNIERKIKNTN